MLSHEVCKRCSDRRKIEALLNEDIDGGDGACPHFEQAWRMNIVVCPMEMSYDGSIPVEARVEIAKDRHFGRGPAWMHFKRPIGGEPPTSCPYSMETLLDGTPREQTFSALLKGKR